ncbi:head-tail connector protein [Diaphorobacter sp.]|uniref:head-tail connector protein n=1 Tax=Diaphorobacter sp. TaxID=1934310 RepID=UPI00258DEBC5|nr:head-tail connector protein [Diaphorobacter sp.]
MSLLTLDEARAHLRVGPTYPAEQIEPYLRGAEAIAVKFLNRNIYESATALQSALAGVPAALEAAADAKAVGLAAADAATDPDVAEWLRCTAYEQYRQALSDAGYVQRGIVINENIKTALRLLLSHLDENRESVARGVSVVEVPLGAEFFLLPDRVGWGG